MGEGLGHAARLLAVAADLRARGLAPVVAARRPEALAGAFAAAGVAVERAPVHQDCFRGPGPFRAASYADLMGVCGYADRERLTAMVAAWDGVLDRLRPALVVADHAPLLSLAACGRVPVIAIGDGFVCPPRGPGPGGFPPIAPGPPVWDPEVLLAHARAVQDVRGRTAPESLPALVAGQGQVVMVPPALDVHAGHRDRRADGPWLVPPLLPPLPGSGSGSGLMTPRPFLYMRAAQPVTRRVLRVIADLGLAAETFIPDAPSALRQALRRHGIVVHETPPPLSEVLARCSVLVSHGGSGVVTEAALLGRPHIVVPFHAEQQRNARQAFHALPRAVAVVAPQAGVAALRDGLPRLFARLDPMAAHAHAQWLRQDLPSPRVALDRLLMAAGLG